MPARHETLLRGLAGFPSDGVARFMWQLEAQRASLLADVAGLDVAALDWQPRRGMNTIAMLLGHIAYAESHLTQVGLEGRATSDTTSVIGLSEEEEGLPLAADAPPSPALHGRPLADYEDMLARARARLRETASRLGDADLAREVVRARRAPREGVVGSERVFNVAWVFYHLIEHEAGHRAQINLLKHLARRA